MRRPLSRITCLSFVRGALAALSVWALASCGGGVGTGGTGGYTSGPVTGFGSVIVAGVRFDDSSAEVEDLDGTRRSRDDLRLGMTVEVDSGAIAADATASATRIRYESELVGLVGAVDVNGGSFNLLGQRVTVDATTVFDDRLSGGLAGLSVGQPLEVYAVFDTALQRYRATRVEPSTVLAGLRLRGPLADVNTGAQTLRIGNVTYGYAGASNVPAGLAAGQFVRLRLELETQPVRWVVKSFATALRGLPENDGARIEGLVTSVASATSFSVNGRAVDASGASISGSIVLGARVEIEGTVRQGGIRATKVTVRSDRDIDDRGFELFGPIVAVNPAQATIVVRGLVVSTARIDLRYDNGTAADLQVGRQVEVRAQLSADQRSLEATRIKFR